MYLYLFMDSRINIEFSNTVKYINFQKRTLLNKYYTLVSMTLIVLYTFLDH